MPILFTIIRTGNDFSVRPDSSPSFFVGRKVEYQGNIGLYNIFAGSKIPKLYYESANYTGNFGFWANFIEPTALCEGRSFLTLNTYDRAVFTFGFGQFAAHVPNGDFVKYLRSMLARPEAPDYFPHLAVIAGRIHRAEFGSAPIELENDQTTKPLMTYLNPGLDDVQDAEVIAAAKLMHWTFNVPDAAREQVEQMIDTYRTFMTRADNRVGIDGRPASECCVIADILHHGRGGSTTWPQIQAALQAADPFKALLTIGSAHWGGRLTTLRKAIVDRPEFGLRRWSRQRNDFV